jgi:hypothetical protein
MTRVRVANRCAYCGVGNVDMTKDHLVPRGLYPASNRDPKIQRITVPWQAIDCIATPRDLM